MDTIRAQAAPATTIAPDCGFTSNLATFERWKTPEGNYVAAGDEFEVPYSDTDYVLTAQWREEYWTIVMHSNNALNMIKRYYILGSEVGTSRILDKADQGGMGLPDYDENGWSMTPNGEPVDELEVTQPKDKDGHPLKGDAAAVHVYAHWERKTYEVKFHNIGGRIIEPELP